MIVPDFFAVARIGPSDLRLLSWELVTSLLIVPFLNPNLCIHHSISMQDAVIVWMMVLVPPLCLSSFS